MRDSQAQEIKKILDRGHIDPQALSTEEVDHMYQVLDREMNKLYLFTLAYAEYMNRGHDYSDLLQLSTLEIHLLTDICDHPESTVTSLAQVWNRSTSATSQTIKKLLQKDLITKKQSPLDGKVFYLRPTDLGRKLSDDHKRYDILDTVKTFKSLRHSMSEEEITAFFKGLDVYLSLLQKK